MTSLRASIFWLLAMLAICPVSYGQVPERAAVTNASAQLLPPLPKSPIATFRDLLAMKPEQREPILAGRPAENRRPLEQKISEYEAMKPEQREAVLAATELRWYLDYFIHAPAAVREPQLASVPARYRQIVSDRVRVFTILPPDLQKDVLNHKTTASYFFGPKALPMVVPPPMPPRSLADVTRLPLSDRQKMYETFQHFFELSDADKQAVLLTLPDARRQQVENTLKLIEQLPAGQRAQGLDSIGKLVLMTGEQQREFFANAARWRELSANERATWLKLVNRLPPLPPGAGLPGPPPIPALSAGNNPP